jgi:hypothetical protein
MKRPKTPVSQMQCVDPSGALLQTVPTKYKVILRQLESTDLKERLFNHRCVFFWAKWRVAGACVEVLPEKVNVREAMSMQKLVWTEY